MSLLCYTGVLIFPKCTILPPIQVPLIPVLSCQALLVCIRNTRILFVLHIISSVFHLLRKIIVKTACSNNSILKKGPDSFEVWQLFFYRKKGSGTKFIMCDSSFYPYAAFFNSRSSIILCSHLLIQTYMYFPPAPWFRSCASLSYPAGGAILGFVPFISIISIMGVLSTRR